MNKSQVRWSQINFWTAIVWLIDCQSLYSRTPADILVLTFSPSSVWSLSSVSALLQRIIRWLVLFSSHPHFKNVKIHLNFFWQWEKQRVVFYLKLSTNKNIWRCHLGRDLLPIIHYLFSQFILRLKKLAPSLIPSMKSHNYSHLEYFNSHITVSVPFKPLSTLL